MINFEDLTLSQLKKIIKAYNLETKISLTINKNKLTKDELVNEIKKHLFIDNDGSIKFLPINNVLDVPNLYPKPKKPTKAQQKKLLNEELKRKDLDLDEIEYLQELKKNMNLKSISKSKLDKLLNEYEQYLDMQKPQEQPISKYKSKSDNFKILNPPLFQYIMRGRGKPKNNELTKKQLKEIEKFLKLKDKEEKELLKRNDPKNIYCFTGDVPNGKFRGSMKQCAEKGEIGYWGQNKADINIVNLSSSKRTKEPSLSKMEKELDKMKVQFAHLKGKQGQIKGNLPYEKYASIKPQMEEQLKKFIDEEKELKKKMQSLKAKIVAKKPKVQKVEKVEQIKEEPVFEEKIKYEIPVQKDFENLSIEEMITLNKELKAITKELENKLDSGEVDEEEEEEYAKTIVQNMKDIKILTKLIKEYTQGKNISTIEEDLFIQPKAKPKTQSKMSPADYKLLEQLAKEGERRQREKKEEEADLARLREIFKNFYN
jgi:hypothetical protein